MHVHIHNHTHYKCTHKGYTKIPCIMENGIVSLSYININRSLYLAYQIMTFVCDSIKQLEEQQTDYEKPVKAMFILTSDPITFIPNGNIRKILSIHCAHPLYNCRHHQLPNGLRSSTAY